MAVKQKTKRVKEEMKAKKSEEAPRHQVTPPTVDFELVADAIVRQCVVILGALDGQRVLVCTGKGQTGALGLATAIKLKRDGARPTILFAYDQNDLTEEGKLYFRQAEANRVPFQQWSTTTQNSVYEGNELLIDALLGASTKGDPRYPLDQIITQMNDSRVPVLSVDVPSGLDPRTGQPGKPTVVAMVTVQVSTSTEKLLNKEGALFVGKVVPVVH